MLKKHSCKNPGIKTSVTLSHQDVLDLLNSVHKDWKDCICSHGIGAYLATKGPSLNQLKQILKRGNHQEILLMIHRYGHLGPSERYVLDCPFCPHFDHHDRLFGDILPEEIQVLIAKRGNMEEISAYLSYQNFGSAAQKILDQQTSGS